MENVGLKSPESPKTAKFDQHIAPSRNIELLTDGGIIGVRQRPGNGDFHSPIGYVESTSQNNCNSVSLPQIGLERKFTYWE